MAFFNSQIVEDIIKECARTEEEFRIHFEEEKAQAVELVPHGHSHRAQQP